MTRPYYEGGGVTLYHGDCRELTAWAAADVLVCDPPYGIAWKLGANKAKGGRAHAGIANDGDTAVRDAVLALWGGRPSVVFGSLFAPWPADYRHLCIWEKPVNAGVYGSTIGFRRDMEGVFLCGAWPARPPQWGSVLRSLNRAGAGVHSPAGRTGHPHAKPVDLLCQLLERAPAGVVADPCAGSGSTLVASRAVGRPAIGVELEEFHCERIARRLDQGALALGGAA